MVENEKQLKGSDHVEKFCVETQTIFSKLHSKYRKYADDVLKRCKRCPCNLVQNVLPSNTQFNGQFVS